MTLFRDGLFLLPIFTLFFLLRYIIIPKAMASLPFNYMKLNRDCIFLWKHLAMQIYAFPHSRCILCFQGIIHFTCYVDLKENNFFCRVTFRNKEKVKIMRVREKACIMLIMQMLHNIGKRNALTICVPVCLIQFW